MVILSLFKFFLQLHVLIPYLLISLYFTKKIFKQAEIYFKPHFVKKSDDSNELVNIHSLNEDFKRKENLSFFKLYLGVTFILWPRFISVIIIGFTAEFCFR